MSVIIQEFHLSVFHDVENIVENYAYTSFGVPKDFNNSVSKNRFTYTGREYEEESGLYYYRARSLLPEIGRFLQSDPDSGELSRPSSVVEKYAYVGNDPINYIDPSGKIRLYGNYCGDFEGTGEPIDNIDESCERHDHNTGEKIASKPDRTRPFFRAQGDLKMALDMHDPKAIFANPFELNPLKNSIVVAPVFFVGALGLATWNIHFGAYQFSKYLLKKIF